MHIIMMTFKLWHLMHNSVIWSSFVVFVICDCVYVWLGLFGAAVFLIGLSFLDCTQTGLAVALLTMGVTVNGCTFSGYFVNHMDIAPKYAGTLMGISNGVAAMSGFIAPYVAAVLTRSVSISTLYCEINWLNLNSLNYWRQIYAEI